MNAESTPKSAMRHLIENGQPHPTGFTPLATAGEVVFTGENTAHITPALERDLNHHGMPQGEYLRVILTLGYKAQSENGARKVNERRARHMAYATGLATENAQIFHKFLAGDISTLSGMSGTKSYRSSRTRVQNRRSFRVTIEGLEGIYKVNDGILHKVVRDAHKYPAAQLQSHFKPIQTGVNIHKLH